MILFYFSFRRHLKASQRKEAFKALEKLKETNPDLFKEKAEKLERARIEVCTRNALLI